MQGAMIVLLGFLFGGLFFVYKAQKRDKVYPKFDLKRKKFSVKREGRNNNNNCKWETVFIKDKISMMSNED